MKEFDLEKAKAGAPVCTRDGRPARIICWDARLKYVGGTYYPIVALIDDEHKEEIHSYDFYGHLYAECDDVNDLMMASTKHEGWINIYGQKDTLGSSRYFIFSSLEKAKEEGKQSGEYITSVKIEWEE